MNCKKRRPKHISILLRFIMCSLKPVHFLCMCMSDLVFFCQFDLISTFGMLGRSHQISYLIEMDAASVCTHK